MDIEKIQRWAGWITGLLFVLMIVGDYLIWMVGFHLSPGTFKDFYVPVIRQSLLIYFLFYALIPFVVLGIHLYLIHKIVSRAVKNLRGGEYDYLSIYRAILYFEGVLFLILYLSMKYSGDHVSPQIFFALFEILQYVIIYLGVRFGTQKKITRVWVDGIYFLILVLVYAFDHLLIHLFFFLIILNYIFFYVFIYFDIEFIKSNREIESKKGLPEDFGVVVILLLVFGLWLLANINLGTWEKGFRMQEIFLNKITFNSYLNKAFVTKLHRKKEIETRGYQSEEEKVKECLGSSKIGGRIVLDADEGYKLELGREKTLYFYPPKYHDFNGTNRNKEAFYCVYAVKRCIHECKVVSEELVEVGYLEVEKFQQRRKRAVSSASRKSEQ